MTEIRKEIPWLPKGKYFVSNLGRVKSKRGTIMKFEHNRYGHQRIKLYGAGGRNDVRHYQVHRLVYCVFNNLDYDFGLVNELSNCYGLVLHKDNDPLNNRLDNLYMGTQKENMHQCINDGRFSFLETKYGEDVSTAKLTEDDVRMMRALCKAGVKQSLIAEKWGIGKSTVNGIINGRTWNHVAR